MPLPQIHQLLHGYRNGHELLAGSVNLPAPDAELVARLSDLSGTLQSDLSFQPYLTMYPLPSEAYYAIAQTWLDKDAPRSGCVLTRTALVPTSDWEVGRVRIRNVLKSLTNPRRSEVENIQRPLLLQQSSELDTPLGVPLLEVEAFAAKYFGEGIRPIVWLRDGDATDLLVSIVGVLWPQLRKRFSACTLSLQPRSLMNTPFDLLFAPIAVYSRFSKVGRENLIEAPVVAKRRPLTETWIKELARAICESRSLPVPSDWSDIDQALSSEPTAVRWLYLLNDLRARTSESPTAALGAMDIVETLCPASDVKTDLKAGLAETALVVGDETSDPDQALSFMQLLCERLSHDSYMNVGDRVLSELSRCVARRTVQSLEQGLASYEELRSRSRDEGSALKAFRVGLANGVVSIAEVEPHKLAILHKFDGAAADIVPNYPAIGKTYLTLRPTGDVLPSRDVARWLNSSLRPVDWLAWSRSLLELIGEHFAEDALLGEVLSKLSLSEVRSFLEVIPEEIISNRTLGAAIEKYLSKSHPLAVRDWALRSSIVSQPVARIASATFDLSASGISELLDEIGISDSTCAAVLVEMLLRIPSGPLPIWLQDSLKDRPILIVRLAAAAAEGNDRAISVILRVLAGAKLLAPEAIAMMRPVLGAIPDEAIFEELCWLVVRSAIIWVLRGESKNVNFNELVEEPRIANWVYEIDGSRLANLVGVEISQNGGAFLRAWCWLASAPEPLYRSRRAAIVSIINLLCRQTYEQWAHEVAVAWCTILVRAKHLSDPRISMRHNVQALGFSLANNRLPLSEVTREAFPTVYAAVAEQSLFADEANSLLSYDWDKAKALRRNLVDSFYGSNWPAGDLALTAKVSFGLRKLFRRVWRKWSGEDYVKRIISDLRKRDEPDAIDCLNELIYLLDNPNFYEPWD